ncbi:cytochrome c-type biogenesis protein CcmF [Methylopila capsulata]|uniref:C-type cytochrome biogenesis protein CcmF n=1 Tax=Methylopila capsulata TaxID=61654 RepID=A0A9W6MSI4_9HYPH|nr:heme lyase CcmF/NrfE family subunit [Methylopila capsulata]MBM7852088.1 cytochrome c-type biogenesis protein CcmF [Methylopila capsulata]GLK56294.1 c-type cytochrome biogenesis protein CcmF [Methylopila capsulata]
MIAEIGHYALVLALALALLQSVLPVWGARARDAALMGLASPLALGQFALVALSFAALTHAYVTSDFSLQNVIENSHSAKPLIYKISGVWGNHEGSLLLWVLILTLFGALVAAFGRNLPDRLKADVLGVQGMIGVAFLLFVLLTSNPFTRVDPSPLEGQDLNPLLQDPGLAIHPPLLYIGYVGFSMAFSFAVAALIEGKVDAAWARWVRPWTLMAWLFLTLGIAMGSYWAYYELGWGGFWFWDPVENASLMPWLSGTALLHSAVVMEKRDALKVWTILLALLTFALSLLGTFLVRSGVLTSVHAFAVDPARGVAILIILAVFVGGSLALYAIRAPALKQGGIFAPVSREGALVLNNLFLTAATAAVFVGTLYPLALEAATGEKISVGPPFFNNTFGPLMLPIMLVMPFAPLLAWKRGDATRAARGMVGAVGVAVLATVLVAGFVQGGPTLAALGVGLALFAIVGAFAEVMERTKLFRAPLAESFRRAKGLPSSSWGGAFAHAGMGVTLLGVVAATAWSSEVVLAMRPGEQIDFAGRQIAFQGVEQRPGPNYRTTAAELVVREGGVEVARLEPARRLYTARKMDLTESSIATFGVSQLYAAMGEARGDGKTALRISYKPLVTLIWLGSIVMAFGGLLSLADRRLRVGAPRKAARPSPAMQPAE